MDFINSFPAAGRVALLAAAAYVVATVYRTYTRPIAKVPGPWYTNWTAIVQKSYLFQGKGPMYAYDLHKKYGPVVRLSPDEVSINNMDDIKIVYSMRETFVKAQTYRNLTPSRTDSMFNTGNVDTHRRYRRMLARPMSESALKPNIDDVHARVSNTVSKMEAEMKTRGAVDIYKWWFFFTTDTIGDLTFGTSFNMTESGQKNQYFMDLQAVNKLGGIRVMFPALIKLAKYVPIPFVKAAQQGGERIRRYAIRLLEAQQKGGSSDCTKDTFFSNIIRANNEETLSFEEVVVNAQSYIVAGSDTTSNTLTFLIWAVVHRPDIQEKLVAELKTLPEDFTEADTRQLKYLDQVIHETLRLFAAAPTTLPREVPAEGVELGGYRVDGGTVVGTSAYMMHRNDKIFPEPFEYMPERWAEPTKEMKDAFMAFGRGARTCIGVHLAMIEIRLAVAMFFRKFPNAKASSLEGMSQADMEPETYFLYTPSGGRCLVEV